MVKGVKESANYLFKQLGPYRGVFAVVVVTVVLVIGGYPWVSAFWQVEENTQMIQELNRETDNLQETTRNLDSSITDLDRTVRIYICLQDGNISNTLKIQLRCGDFNI